MRNPDTWKVVVEVEASDAETAEYALAEIGALGSIEENAGSDEVARITAFFDKQRFEQDALRDLVSEAFKAFPNLKNRWVEVELEPAKDWNEKWRKLFKPFEIAKGFVVVPSWEKYDLKEGEMAINLDPGMAFGTGLHETTRLCADALFDHIATKSSCSSMIDMGTGSGILAIIASKLGVTEIAGVDNDPDALIVARENFQKNDCSDIKLFDEVNKADAECDIVIANILLPVLLKLREDIVSHVAPGGLLILSGITHDQESSIMDAYAKNLSHKTTEHRGEWSSMMFVQRS